MIDFVKKEPGRHTGSASSGLPNSGAKASIKRLLTSIKETASET